MGLQKVAFNFMAERGGKLAKSLLCHTKPPKLPVNIKGFKYQPLATDTIQFARKETEQITKKADELLLAIRKECNAEYYEKNFPDIVKNAKSGNITTYSTKYYLDYLHLERFSKENPEAFVFFGEKGSVLKINIMADKYGDTPISIAKEMPINELKKVFGEIDALGKKWDFEPTFWNYVQMLMVKKHNPKTYEYILNTKDTDVLGRFVSYGDDFDISTMPSSSFFKNVTPEQLHAMVYDSLPPMKNIGAYVEDSDSFAMNTKAVEELSKDLSKCKLSSDIKLYRGEKTVGMFNSVEVGKDFEKQLRQLLEANKDKAKNMKVSKYTGMYGSEPNTSLYDFLSSKETLTLADAMQLAKFGDDKLVNEIIKRIKTSKIIDERFKSLSFDKGMAGGWMSHNAGDNTTIIQNATVKQGTQGGFHDGANAQYEVILNNTPKEMTFPEVVYHKDTDYFELQSVIQNI